MQQPRLQYVKSADGVQIAYTSFGEGEPAVWVANAWGDIEMFMSGVGPPLDFWKQQRVRAVVYDGRNAGSSDRGITDVSLDARVRDLAAVVEATGTDTVNLIGVVHGTTTAVAYAAKHPERVSRMALISAYANGAEFYSATPMLRAIKALTEIAEEEWELFTLTLANWAINFANSDVARHMADIYRRSMTPQDYCRLIAAAEDTDVTNLLPLVKAPTMVVRVLSLQFSLMPQHTKAVAGAIPGAQQITVDQPTDITNAMAEFFGNPQPVGDGEHSAFRAVLFTDLVGHTDMMTRLGDAKGREILREHERITREVLAANGGTEVKTMGDGFMASFGSVTKAVNCAVSLQRAFSEHTDIADEPLHVRVGLNAGEPIEEDGDLFGSTVILASRIAAKARGGEILVANAVRELCSGKGFLFSDRGEFVPKGFEDAVRLYDVRWRDE